MNEKDLYHDREDLMTLEELEEYHHDPGYDTIPTYTPNMKQWLFAVAPRPDGFDKERFMARLPSIGATHQVLEETREHYKVLSPVQQRLLFQSIRSSMLGTLIPCPGASTMDELLDILKAELDRGVPAPIPDWYTFSSKRYGPRIMGYYGCSARGCFETETAEKDPFSRCAGCKMTFYCSRKCQVADWKARHKQVCKEGSKKRDDVKKAADFLQMFVEQSEGKKKTQKRR